MKRCFPVCSAVLAFLALFLPAGVASAEIALDGSFGRSGALTGPDFLVSADAGQLTGSNLFHSFSVFSLAVNESATFTGPATVENVVSRVTGGGGSFIDGTIVSDMPAADFFFLNPSGIMFGPHASLDIGGSFHASTAGYLKLGDGGRFDALNPGSSALTVAPPSAFGFMGNDPAGIAVHGSYLRVSEGAGLSFVGGDLAIENSNLYAPAGRIHLIAVSSQGEVRIADDAVTPGSFGELGSIAVSENRPAEEIPRFSFDPGSPVGNIDVSSTVSSDSGAGLIIIRGNQFVSDGGRISAYTYGGDSGGGIDAETTGSFVVMNRGAVITGTRGSGDGGSITVKAERFAAVNSDVQSMTSGEGDTGGVLFDVDEFVLEEGAQVVVTSLPGSSGRGGSLTVNASGLVSISGSSAGGFPSGLFNQALGENSGGTILISTPSFFLGENGALSATTYGSGNAGDISVYAGEFRASGGLIQSLTLGSGNAGNVLVGVANLTLTDGAQIDVSGRFGSTGSGGSLRVIADGAVYISGVNSSGGTITPIPSGLVSKAGGEGDGGNIWVTSPELVMDDFGKIDASTTYAGNAGEISIAVDNLRISDSARISAISEFGASGDGGNVTVTASDSVTISDPGPSFNEAGIFASTHDIGDGGTITVITPHLVVDGGRIEAPTQGFGNAGSIVLEVDDLFVIGGGQIGTTSFFEGSAGDLSVTARDSVTIAGDDGIFVSGLYATTLWSGAGGNLSVFTPRLEIAGGFIGSATEGTGDAGNILLSVDSLAVVGAGQISSSSSGTGDGGGVAIHATDTVHVSGIERGLGSSAIVTNALDAGNGGSIRISADSLVLDEVGIIQSITRGDGGAGEVVLTVHDMFVTDGGQIDVGAREGSTGSGGNLTIQAEGAVEVSGTYSPGSGVYPSGLFSRAEGSGSGGSITIRGSSLNLSGNARISGSTSDAGRGGDIRLHFRNIDISDHGVVTAGSTGPGNAGNIVISAGGLMNVRRSSVTTEAIAAAGGNIDISGGDVLLTENAEVTASVASGPGGGGNVTISADSLVALEDSDITARADQGFGGDITIDSGVVIFSDDVDLDASSNVAGREGAVTVTSPVVDITGGLIALPASFLDAESLLPARCEAYDPGRQSSFAVFRSRKAPDPDEPLMSR